jgi:hypothetical protein
MVLNATFNNISDILWWSVLLLEQIGSTLRKPLTQVTNKLYLFVFDLRILITPLVSSNSSYHKMLYRVPEWDSNSQH